MTQDKRVGEVGSKGRLRPKRLVVYHFYEKDRTYLENFLHFLAFGYSEENEHIVVVSGKPETQLPELPNLTYFRAENKNNDYGGYCVAIDEIIKGVESDYIFFINSSVRGPFVPVGGTAAWTSMFENKLSGDVGLVGPTINILALQSPHTASYRQKYGGHCRCSHVQTSAYAMTGDVLKYLYGTGFYDEERVLTKHQVIEQYELRLSQLVLDGGWNIACLLPEYDAIDFRREHDDINPTSFAGDPQMPHAYFGRTPHPYELVFVKTNRKMFNEPYLNRLAASALSRRAPGKEVVGQAVITRYLNELKSAAGKREAVLYSDVRLAPKDLANATALLMRKSPQFRTHIRRLLNDIGTDQEI